MVLVGVDRLQHPVGGSGPGRDPLVVAVQPLQGVPLVVGHRQRPPGQGLPVLASVVGRGRPGTAATGRG